ncbi:MAG: hypothetical protein IT364_26710 [Candidatus Hydrogenedentes bacterium]|nr:hypothetical protein [Candidatus Hydrogenedentota bacterium]
MNLVALLLVMHPIGLAAEKAAEAIDVADRKQLFIDTLFIESSETITLRVHPSDKTNERTLVSDRPWEDATLNWFNVLEDSGKYRMWYECYDVEGWPTTDDTSFCYAESTDGIAWSKPPLGLFSYHESTDNNILFRQIGDGAARSRVHGAGVFLDPSAPPDARYKAVSQGIFSELDPPHRVAGMQSPDGFHWARVPRPICDVFADSQYSGFWDDAIGQYVLFGRVAGRGRSIGRSASASFDRFEPLSLVFQTDEQDVPDTDLYNPAALKYAYADRVYLMFPSMYNHVADTLDIHIAVSRDGIHWSWPERGRPFIALGAAGSFDSGSLYMGQGLLRVGDEIWQYYSGSPLKHNEAELDALAIPENKRVFSRAVNRLDGFVSAEAGEMEGRFVTPLLIFTGRSLHLNVKTSPGGDVRVGILDSEGQTIDGHGTQDCEAITGDHVDIPVAWKNASDLAKFAVQPVKLEFLMKDANLFAFQFRP